MIVPVIIGLVLSTLDLILKQFFPYVLNTGSIYGFEFSNMLILIVHIFLLLFLFFKVFREEYDTRTRYILIVIAFASISNLVDRIVFGGVRDYINLVFYFNLADIVVVSGIMALIIGQIYESQVYSSKTRSE